MPTKVYEFIEFVNYFKGNRDGRERIISCVVLKNERNSNLGSCQFVTIV